MKIFTTALLVCATIMGVSAQEVVFEDDFSWLNVPAITTSTTLYDTSAADGKKESNFKFDRKTVTALGLNNPGWESGDVNLNDDHTERTWPPVPEGMDPKNIFEETRGFTFMRPGFLKLGQTGIDGAIISPAFEKLGDRTADVEVTMQMCAYTSAGSATAAGTKDDNKVFLALWDGSDGEVADADHEQIANNWPYDCKTIIVTNYHESKAKEYGDNYNVWDPAISTYTARINGATAKTRLYILAGGFMDEHKNLTEPTTVTHVVNGKEVTFKFNAKTNRIAFKGCVVKIVGSTGIDEINADNEAPVEYFNLQGIRVANPAKGQIYIKRQGSKATKIAY